MHQLFMRRCLELAERGRGLTGVNPMVGAVLVRDGVIIAEGFHAEFGKAHAERDLLEKYEQKIRSTDTLYVNLEPCCHTNKKTSPCAQMLIKRGIKKIVYGMKDPNPAVAGKGIELLNKNSVQTLGPVLEQDCKRMNRGFVSLMTKGRPWITLKQAVTYDGRTANNDGSPLKITSEAQDAWSHRFLRAQHDAILVGVGTIVFDNPRLTVRHIVSGDDVTGPWKIILDPTLRIPIAANVVASRTIIVTRPDVDETKTIALRGKGARVLHVPLANDSFEWKSLWDILITPADDFHGIASLLVEGGPTIWKYFRDAKVVDEEVLLIGNHQAKTST